MTSSSHHEPPRRLRVVQWTTGKTGRAAARGILANPSLELVGCYAFSPDKVGADIGTLVGVDPVGIAATRDVETLLALRPDCVTYNAFRPDFDHLERILGSGINVVTTMYMLAGAGYGEDVAQRLSNAAIRGGASLYASGIYPGHAAMVALAASAMCTRIDRLSILESVDMSGYANEQMFRAMGIDRAVDDPDVPGIVEASCGSFKEQLRVLADALAVELDSIRFEVEFAAATATTDFGFMTVRKGHIAGFRGVLSGVVASRPVVQCKFVWKLGARMTPDWPVEHGYVLEIEGEPGVRVRLEPLHEPFDGAVTTAMPMVNAISQVVSAPPGIVNHAELPFAMARHLVRTRP